MPAEDGRKQASSSDRKRRRAKYLPHNQKKAVISHGQQGFLVTCVGGKERSSIQEMINVLDEFYERPSSPTPVFPEVCGDEVKSDHAADFDSSENKILQDLFEVRADTAGASEHCEEESEDESDDEGAKKLFKLPNSSKSTRISATLVREESSRGVGIDELLAAEIDELRDKKKARFVGCETGCHGVVFVRMHKEYNSVLHHSPMDLAEAIVRDAAATKKPRTRYSMRLLPVETTCYASGAEVAKAAETIVARHFPNKQGCPSYKFAVTIEARANTTLDKMELIDAVAKIVPKPHSVDLKNPDKTILLQIVKTTCAIGVVRDFKELAKYNLRQLTQKVTQRPPETGDSQAKPASCTKETHVTKDAESEGGSDPLEPPGHQEAELK